MYFCAFIWNILGATEQIGNRDFITRNGMNSLSNKINCQAQVLLDFDFIRIKLAILFYL